MGGLFESPKSEAQPVWERIPPEAKDIYMNFLKQYSNFLGQTGGAPPPSPLPIPSVNIGPISPISVGQIREPTVAPVSPVRLPEELRQRYLEVLRGGFDPSTSPGMQAIIQRMEEGGRRAVDMALQRLAMAGHGPGSPMAQATAELAGVTQARIGEALQEALNREYQAALGMLREGMGADIETMRAELARNLGLMQAQQARDIAQTQAQLQADMATMRAQLERDIAQASLELQRYGMVTQETMNRYLATLQALQGAATMTTNLLGAFLPPPQYGQPPIMGLLGPLSLFFRK